MYVYMNLSVVNTPYLYEFVSCEYTLFIWIRQLWIHPIYMNLSVVNTPYLYEFVSCEYTLIYVNLSVVNTPCLYGFVNY